MTIQLCPMRIQGHLCRLGRHGQGVPQIKNHVEISTSATGTGGSFLWLPITEIVGGEL